VRSIAVAIAVTLSACTSQAATVHAPVGQPQTGLERVVLTISSATGVHHFNVEVARTEQQQSKGLMFVRTLARNHGMIFPFSPPQEVSFWMENTLIPLDIVFIRQDHTIARITKAKPLDETLLPSGEPIIAVLEIAGGRAAQLGIAPGDKVSW
jgi:uncharacterized membrane protein (UPF0127 family)